MYQIGEVIDMERWWCTNMDTYFPLEKYQGAISWGNSRESSILPPYLQSNNTFLKYMVRCSLKIRFYVTDVMWTTVNALTRVTVVTLTFWRLMPLKSSLSIYIHQNDYQHSNKVNPKTKSAKYINLCQYNKRNGYQWERVWCWQYVHITPVTCQHQWLPQIPKPEVYSPYFWSQCQAVHMILSKTIPQSYSKSISQNIWRIVNGGDDPWTVVMHPKIIDGKTCRQSVAPWTPCTYVVRRFIEV
jgi:hypothetical protein